LNILVSAYYITSGILQNDIMELQEAIIGVKRTREILQVGLWWPTIFKDAKEYVKSCNVCQRIGKPLRMDEFPLHPIKALQSFEKWFVDFNGPISPPAKHSKAYYNITATNYLVRRENATPTKDCSRDTTICFNCSQITTRFGYTRISTSNQGHNILSTTITTPT
jgi:hypothetical protein